MDVATYIDRIGHSGPTTVTAEALCDLHRSHMLSVPFENLDIGLGRKIVCDEGAFIRKIVELRRGGFCYELNGAFSGLLRAIGFKVTLLSARVSREDGSSSPEFDHSALKVDLDEPWLADVGFGDSFLEPLRLEPIPEQLQDARRFRIVDSAASLHVEKAEPNGAWKRQYSFTLVPRRLGDFAGMCHYHQTSPKSHFTQGSICTRPTPMGRTTLADHKLIITRNGVKEEKLLESEEQWRAALKEHFGIML